ncbi:MarR family transcriptional regulator [Sulfitobacter sp. EhC04]|uniref:MarR family winged helix-turn-helix transcriptional regulator n=1 Tax=Sulfitobacter sp. EhC04 TaxID=1849168 RepID=UPI0007F3AFE9|nr:MarR family transcriptional regulator [Sulfitobacter sp. EhC04]OAN67843.1 MarR family transcriptional regulator [Sulfitobacter sp. EhC04]
MVHFKDKSAGYLVNHLARLLEQALAVAIRPLGLTPGQFPTLLALWARDGQTQAELVREVDVEQATMALTLKRMERDGLIRRERNPEDSRSRLIYLTPHAKALEDRALAQAAEVNARALADLDEHEAQQFLSLAIRLVETLRKAPD